MPSAPVLPRVLWFDRTRFVIEVSRGHARSLLVYRDGAEIVSKHVGLTKIEEEYTDDYLGRGPQSVTNAARALLRSSADVTPHARRILEEILMEQEGTATSIRNACIELAKQLPADHKLAKIPNRFADKASAQKRYDAIKLAVDSAGIAAAVIESNPELKEKAMTTKKAPSKKSAAPTKGAKKEKAARGRKPAVDEATRFVAIISEDDLRLHEESRRTKVFRAVAEAGKRGITLADIAKKIKLSIDEVRAECRTMSGGSRPRFSIA